MSHLLCNKWKCKDGTILASYSRHDYVSHTDANGEYYFVDGGLSYIRHSGNMEPMCVYTTDSHNKIRENFEWGSYGKSGTEKLHYILLKDMEDQHISAILRTQTHLPEHILEIFNAELFWRLYKE